MRKTLVLLALGAFLSASSIASACDGDKVAAKSKHDCCMKGSKAKTTIMKASKDCSKDPKCMQDIKASKTTPKKDQKKG